MAKFDLLKSPIRKNINSLGENDLSVFEEGGSKDESFEGKTYKGIQVRTILRDVENMLGAIDNHSDDIVRIAVMGEVKAGKSTFINTLVGREVAYTDILEATALVSEITYSEDEYVRLIGADGNVAKEFSLDEMLAWMEDMVDDEGDFSVYERIDIGISNDFLENLIIVDTPGLFSITSRNHDVTNKYVKDTDYILWVINSRDLGSKVVNDYIDKIKLSGKPIIGIINKVDSENERKEIEDYINKEYGSIFEDIYFVSSKKAWELMKNGEDDWQEQTNFDDILDCIEELAECKEHSTSQTQYYQLQRDREVHTKMRERIKERKGYYDNEIGTFSYINSEIKKTVKREINNWIKNEFFVDEKQKLLGAGNEEFKKLIESYSDSVYLTNIIEDKYNEISSFICNKWKIVTSLLSLDSSQVVVDFTYDKTIEFTDEAEQSANDNSQSIKEGLKKGAAIGVAFAGYWAWLGPAAATATFVGSVVPITIPFAIGGAVAAGMVTKSSMENITSANAKKKQEMVDDLYNEVLQLVTKEGGKMQKALIECSEHYYEDKCKEYKERTSQFNFDFTEPSFGTFMSELDEYIDELDKAIASLEKAEIPKPPTTDGLYES